MTILMYVGAVVLSILLGLLLFAIWLQFKLNRAAVKMDEYFRQNSMRWISYDEIQSETQTSRFSISVILGWVEEEQILRREFNEEKAAEVTIEHRKELESVPLDYDNVVYFKFKLARTIYWRRKQKRTVKDFIRIPGLAPA